MTNQTPANGKAQARQPQAKGRSTSIQSQMRAALQRSGYLLEYRIASLLEARDWRVVPNYAFSDNKEGKTRELDVLASKQIELEDGLGAVRVLLLVECVNNESHPFVVFPRPNQHAGALQYCIRTGGWPLYIRRQSEATFLAHTVEAAEVGDWHPVCTAKTAFTQFCSFKPKDKGKADADWMAFHEDSHFGCFQALLQAVTHLRDYYVQDIRKGGMGKNVQFEMYFPVLALQGSMFEATPGKAGVHLAKAKRSVFRRGTVEGGVNTLFPVEVVIESEVSKVASDAEAALSRMKTFFQANEKEALESLIAMRTQVLKRVAIELRSKEKNEPDNTTPWPEFAQ